MPRTEPVRPIDPGAWVAHTAAVRGLEIPQYPGSGGPVFPGAAGGVGGALRAPSVSTLTSSSPSLVSTVQERGAAAGGAGGGQLTIQSGMKAICSCMQRPDSGLEVRDRMWLKINIPQAFIGNDGQFWPELSLTFLYHLQARMLSTGSSATWRASLIGESLGNTPVKC